MNHRIVITGMGAITPIGTGKEVFWRNLLAGVSGVRRVHFSDVDMAQYKTRIAATVDNFTFSDFLPGAKKTKYLGRTSQMAIAAAKLALEDAGFALTFEKRGAEIKGVDPFDIGVILGTASGNEDIFETGLKEFFEDRGPKRTSPHALPYQLISSVAAALSITFSCRGTSYVIPTACSSAAQAIGNSFRHLKNGPEQVMITGGADCAITPVIVAGFQATRAMSTRSDEPEKASRPFDRMRDGFVMGEGAGIIILEKLEHALKRNAPIYAELIGFGMNCDAYHITIPEPEGRSFVRAIRMAMAEARIRPENVDYINAHGTSTKLNDAIETRAIKTVFGKRAYDIPVSSTKSMIGHLLGAAMGVEMIATVMSLRDDKIHPTINYEFPDPDCDLDYVPNQMREMPVNLAVSNSLGFGGFNAVLIVRKFQG
ncbi:MAG: beta-ketoacyl-ACP synthase II [Deltaproteobacteria bacterium]|nr:beta-ketoacyl-ACP synthase II [Deltaproteobacteria bacterium]